MKIVNGGNLLLLLLSSLAIIVASNPNCRSKCGDFEIPFPFGIEDGCFLNDSSNSYNVKCINGAPMYNGDVSLLNISVENHTLRIKSGFSYECYNRGEITVPIQRTDLILPHFTVSTTYNKFVAMGCDTQANVVGTRRPMDDPYATGCTTYCTELSKVQYGKCSGVGCCETPIPEGVTNIKVSAWSFSKHKTVDFNPCSAAIVVENGELNFTSEKLEMGENGLRELKLPVVLDWWIVGVGCNPDKKLCGEFADCSDYNGGHRCVCMSGYAGNPYLTTGCRDIDECSLKLHECEKQEYCTNTEGGFKCVCPKHFDGNGTTKNPCYPSILNKEWWETRPLVRSVVGIFVAMIILIGGLIWLILCEEKKRLLEMRETFFFENGGIILSQKLYGRDITSPKLKLFKTYELEDATQNYSECRIVGHGGFGVVYKGILANGQVVAIKKSLKVSPTDVDKFINEVLILSEINNKNIVKLLGCCLETEVPLLVYEFITNGTLYEHLHDDRKATMLSWDIRLSIAKSVASVLYYLHTTISTPIIHRDIKSMNILLDENYVAKVSDFGCSKLVPMDRSQLVTMVLGTWGYLDPEYMQTSELTEKSDVYSFGVVLVELLARKKVLSYDSPEDERCLTMNFLRKVKEDRLFDIIDEQIREIENLDHIIIVANLAKRCLAMKGEERPTMKEVARELEEIKMIESYPSFEVDTRVNDCELLFIETLMESKGSNVAQYMKNQEISLLALRDGR